MKICRFIFLMVLVFFMTGCLDKNNNNDQNNNEQTVTEVSEETLKLVIERYEFDINYPYAFDYFVKEMMSNVEGIENFYFEMIEPSELVVGENNIKLKVTYPDEREEQYNILLTTYEVDKQYDIDNFIFNKETNTIEGYVGDVRDLSIPEVIDGELVLKIKEEAFKGKKIDSLYLPITITEIGANAFSGTDIHKLVIPKFVNFIGDYAFMNCRLTDINIQSITLDFGYFSFYGNNEIQNIILDEVNNQDYLIENWIKLGFPISKIPNIQLKNNMYYLEEAKTFYGFDDYSKFSDPLQFPNLVKELGVEKIANYAFYGNEIIEFRGIGEYFFGDSIKIIGKYAFANNHFNYLELPEGLIQIEEYAFSNSSIEELKINSSVNDIKANAFENINPRKITVVGNETRFNDNWEAIGLPTELKPLVREKITPIYSLTGEKEDYITKTMNIDGVVYGIGYSCSKEGDFENDSQAVILPFLMKFDLSSNEGYHKLIINQNETQIIDFVYLGEGVFIGCGYKVNNEEVLPYIFKFNTDLELIEEFQISDPNMRIINMIAVNENNEIAIVSENKNNLYDLYDIIIYNSNFTELYRYQFDDNIKKLRIFDLINDGTDFIAVGSINDPNNPNYNDSSSMDSYIIKLNKNGVLWQKTLHEDYYQELYFIEKDVENSVYIIYGKWEFNNGETFSDYQLTVDSNGNIIKSIIYKTLGFSVRYNDIIVDDKIYIFGIEDYDKNYSKIYVFDKEYNYLEKLQFLDNTISVIGVYYYDNKAYLFIDSRDSYIDNNSNMGGVYIISWILS